MREWRIESSTILRSLLSVLFIYYHFRVFVPWITLWSLRADCFGGKGIGAWHPRRASAELSIFGPLSFPPCPFPSREGEGAPQGREGKSDVFSSASRQRTLILVIPRLHHFLAGARFVAPLGIMRWLSLEGIGFTSVFLKCGGLLYTRIRTGWHIASLLDLTFCLFTLPVRSPVVWAHHSFDCLRKKWCHRPFLPIRRYSLQFDCGNHLPRLYPAD